MLPEPFLLWKATAYRTLLFVFLSGFLLGLIESSPFLLARSGTRNTATASSLCGPRPGSIESLFAPDITFGNLTISEAKTIDISWNLFMGHRFQSFVGVVSYQVVTGALLRMAETTLVECKLIAALVFTLIGISAMTALAGAMKSTVDPRFKLTLIFLLLSVMFILAPPTVMDISTGYIQNLQAYRQLLNDI
jgi:hypothetical protein